MSGANVEFNWIKKTDLFSLLWTISVNKSILRYYQDNTSFDKTVFCKILNISAIIRFWTNPKIWDSP